MTRENPANKKPEIEDNKVLHLDINEGVGNVEVVSSPLRLIVSIMVCVFAVEALIMLVLSWFPFLSVGEEALVDSLFLTVLITPLVYLLIYRQLNEHIKKRRAAESAYMSSAEHLRSVVESAAEPIISMDSNGDVIFWNAVAEDVFGYTREEMLGKPASIIVSDEDKDAYYKLLKPPAVTREKRPVGKVVELVAMRKDGSRFPVELSLSQWRTEDGEFFTAVIRDISERREVDEALQASRQMFFTVLDSIPVRVFWKDRDLNYLGCNMPFAMDAGLDSPIDLIGKDDFQMPWQEQADLYREDDRKILESGEIRLNFEEPQTSPDGTPLTLRTSKIPLRNAKGEIFGVLGVYEDITEQKQARDALKARTRQQAVVADLGQLALSGVELPVLFDSAVQTLVDTLEVEYSKILKLLPDQKSLLLSAGAGWKDGLVGRLILKAGAESQAGYTLNVGEPVIVTDLHIEERFNGLDLLKDHNVVSGMSVIIGSIDHPYGVLGVHSVKKRVFTSDDVNFLQAVANVLAEAVRRKGSEESFQALFSSTAESTGEEFFYKTVESLGEWLDADCVIIGEFVEDNNVETLAMILDDQQVHGFSYALPGSPCEKASESGFCMYPEGIIKEFPNDETLIKMGAHGYAGVPLKNSDGEAIGILCAISRSRLLLPPKGREIFEMIAARVEAEVERRRAEESLKSSEKHIRSIVESVGEGIVEIDSSSRICLVNEELCRVFGYIEEELINREITMLMPERYRKEHIDGLKEYLLSESSRILGKRIQIEGLHKDGTIFPIEMRIEEVMVEGERRFTGALRDITERRQVEEALRESEERFRDIADNSEVWIWEVDKEGMYTYASPLVENILGYKPEEVVGKYFFDLITPDEREMLEEKIKAVFSNKEPFKNVITTKIHKDGTSRVCETSGVPIVDGDGNLVGYRGSVSDITERRHADEERRKLTQAINQSPAVVLITDVEGNIEYVNPRFTETTGYTFDEVRGKNPRILNSGQTSKAEYKKLWKTIKSGKEWRGEFLNKKKNGALYYEAATISPVMDEEGKITNFIAVKEDITEKKRAESMITRIGRILEDSLNEIYIFDAKTFKYLEANHGARKNLGYTMKELHKLTPVDLKPDMTREEFEKILKPLRSGKKEKIEFNTVHRRKDGSTFPVEIHVQTTTFESSPAFFSIILDQTKHMEGEEEKKRLQAQLLQAQKMEAVGVLAAGVAHDFNNILTIIRLRAENAMEEVGEASPAYEDMKEACEASKNAADLTRQLLLFSRKQALEFINGDLNVSIASLLKMLGRLIGENYSVKTDLSTALKQTRFDKGGIEQMIVNLVINARDSMPDGGSILIKTENARINRVRVSDHPDRKAGDFVRLSVIDKGAGMDKETQDHIFEPFFTTKGVGKGTGLGLSVVYGIIMQHEGWVEVSSVPSKGTTFDLYIPVSTETVDEHAEKNIVKDKPQGDGRRILLVEDEAGLRQITAKLLKSSGFTVLEAKDYTEAMDIFEAEKGKFDLLLSDVILPDKTGIELAEDLKGKNPELKLVLCSGYTDERSQWPLIRERGYNFLQKPYSLDELISIIMEVVEG